MTWGQATAAAFDPRSNFRRLFVRTSAGTDHLAALDGIRSFALLWVIALHSGWYALFALRPRRYFAILHMPGSLPIWRGDFAVDVFFVLSAFLIGGILLDERARNGRVRVLAFYARRLLRIWPALLGAAMLEASVAPERADAPSLVWTLFYVNNLMHLQEVRMGWTWSLAIEEQFYLTAPWVLQAVAHLAERVRRLASALDPVLFGLALLLVLQIGVSIAIVAITDMRASDVEIMVARPFPSWHEAYDVLYSKPWMRAGPLLAGLGCAHLWRRPGFRDRLSASGRAGTLGLVLAVVLGMIVTHWPWFARIPRPLEILYVATFRTAFGFCVAYAMLLVLSQHGVGARIGRFLGLPLFFPIAQLAYCAYLVNPIVAMHSHRWLGPSLGDAPPRIAYLTFLGFDLLGTFSLALVLSLAIERPFMALRKTLVP